MPRKPWTLLIFATLFVLIPIGNIVLNYFALAGQYEFSDYIYSLITIDKNRMLLFNFVVPSLIAAYAIYSVKNWSIPVFIAAIFWLLINIAINVFSTMGTGPAFVLILIALMTNLFFLFFILIPNLRKIYFNPKIRWWESRPRFKISTEVKLHSNNGMYNGRMLNFSDGGLFLENSKPLKQDEIYQLEFEIRGINFNLLGKVVHGNVEKCSYGIQFHELNIIQKKELENLSDQLLKDKVEEVRVLKPWQEDFKDWFKTVIKTGKGIIPEIPNRFK